MAIKTAVLTPYFGGVDFFHWQLIEQMLQSSAEIIQIRHFGCPWIDMSRAYLVERALNETETDIFFWIDHDMIFNPKDVVLMADRCRASSYDVLAAGYVTKKPGGRIVAGVVADKVEFFVPGLYESDAACGFGFTAIKREVFVRLAKDLPHLYCPAVDSKVYPFFSHDISDVYLGEDVSFYRRVKKAGFTIALDAEPRLYHRGAYDYGIEDSGITVPRYERLTAHTPKEEPKAAE